MTNLDVFLDGKLIRADIVNLDLEAGWIEIPDLSMIVCANDEVLVPGDNEQLVNAPVIKLPTKKLFGKITVKVSPDIGD